MLKPLVYLLLVGLVLSHSFTETSKVLQLTIHNFSQITGIGFNKILKNTFVMFYAPWCGHCKALIPIYEEFAEKAQDINVVSIDCTQDKGICKEFAIKSYPTLMFFTQNGQQINYSKQRTVEQLISFSQEGYKVEESKDVSYSIHNASITESERVAERNKGNFPKYELQEFIDELSRKVGGPIPLALCLVGIVVVIVLLVSGLKEETAIKKKAKETESHLHKE